jgi:hypothetical protein
MKRTLAQVLLPVAVTLGSTVAFAAPAHAAGSGTATVGLSADAWYTASAACTTTPTGCLPVGQPPGGPYPAGTLHAGVVAGQEESRSYLLLDLAAIPAGTTISSGTLRLPVGATEDGSRAPDTATLQACAVKGSLKDDIDGSTEQPPEVDCKAATSPAKYVAAAGTLPAAFTVDLAPFAAAWSSGGATSAGIALLPASDTAPTSAWHVALSAHDRQVAAPMRITATVTYGSATGDFEAPSTLPPLETSVGTGTTSFGAPPLAPVATPQLPAAVTPDAPAVAPQAPPVAPVQQVQAVASVGGFAYPGVFLLPILLAIVAGWLARALTRDLSPAAVATARAA